MDDAEKILVIEFSKKYQLLQIEMKKLETEYDDKINVLQAKKAMREIASELKKKSRAENREQYLSSLSESERNKIKKLEKKKSVEEFEKRENAKLRQQKHRASQT